MKRDKLILMKPNFLDPAYPDARFSRWQLYRWRRAPLEGVLRSFPVLAERVEAQRIAWPRPRREVVGLLGHEHRSLPVLLPAEGADESRATGRAEGRSFGTGKDATLAALTDRRGIPVPHR